MSTPTRLSLSTIALLTTAPLMWAGNAIVGRLAAGWIPPVTFNFLRWLLAALVLLPLAASALRPGSALWRHWRRYAWMGLFAICGYNTLQYLALNTSSPVNATLVASSMPVWMLLVGRVGYGAAVRPQSLLGAVLSLAGVLVVLGQGDWARLQALQLVPGDAWMLLAAFVWSCYSWLLTRAPADDELRPRWAHFLLAQVAMGLLWSALTLAGEWWWLSAHPRADGLPHVQWSPALWAVLLFVALGPALLAYRCWGAGVQRAGPTIAAFFSNLTPLFAALMSATFLGEPPRLYHGLAFALIVGGIWVSSLGTATAGRR